MSARVGLLLAVVGLLWGGMVGCDGDDEPSTDGGPADVAGDPGAGDTAVGDGEEVDDDATSGDAVDEGDADAEAEVVERLVCDPVPADTEAVAYDLVSEFATFVGQAEVTASDGAVSVTIPDDPEPIVFEGNFVAGSNCFEAEYESIGADICFFDAVGAPAEPETLGANIYAFLTDDHSRPTATILGAMRRGTDRTCSPGGFFELDASDVSLTAGDLPTEVVDAVLAEFLTYLAIFELGEERVTVAVGVDAPQTSSPEAIDLVAGDLELDISTFVAVTIDASELDYDVDLVFTGSVDLATGALSGSVTADVEGESVSGTLSGALTGTRN